MQSVPLYYHMFILCPDDFPVVLCMPLTWLGVLGLGFCAGARQRTGRPTDCRTVPLLLPLPESDDKWRELHILLARYATYLGLCVATLIIFKRSVSVASAIGVCVAVYIGFSEYTLSNWKDHSISSSVRNVMSW